MATPSYATVINQINTFIVANGNNKITANVLNPILDLITDFANNHMGDLSTLTTDDTDNLVAAINSLKQNISDITDNSVQLYTGIGNPNDTPPPSYNYADFFMQLGPLDNEPIQLWQFDGFGWTTSLGNSTHFKGFFNATTLTPAISNLNGIEGDEYKVTNGGVNVDFGAGNVYLETDDIIIFHNGVWMVKVTGSKGGTVKVPFSYATSGQTIINVSTDFISVDLSINNVTQNEGIGLDYVYNPGVITMSYPLTDGDIINVRGYKQVGALPETTPPIPFVYDDINELTSDQANQIANFIYEVTDGSGFSGIDIGKLWVKYLGTTNGDESDYTWQPRPSGAGLVDSVNSKVGDVVLDADDISDTSTTNKFVTSTEKGLISTALQTETDPVFIASQAFNIDSTDITNLSNLSGVNTGDQDLSPYQLSSEKGSANGYTPLDSGSKVPIEFLPDSVVGQVEYQGAWNASTNTPNVGDATTKKGHYYVTSVAGTYLGISYEVGDWIISNGATWQKVDNTDAVTSVFGRIGAVVANAGDYAAFYSPIITGGGSTIVSSNLTANRALLSNASGKVAVSDITSTELGYLDNVTSNIQTQLNAKLAASSYTAADVLTKLLTVDGSGSGLDADLLRGVHWGNVNTDIITSESIGIGTGGAPNSKLEVVGNSDYNTINLKRNNTPSTAQRVAVTGRHYDASEENVSGILMFSDELINAIHIGGATAVNNSATQIAFWTSTNNTTVTGTERMRITGSGNVSIGNANDTYKLDVTGTGRFTGTVIAAPATLSTELVTKGQLDAFARPYKVYTALLSQSGTSAPTAIVLENTLGGTIVWTRSVQGVYNGTLTGSVFTAAKTVVFITAGSSTVVLICKGKRLTDTTLQLVTSNSSGVGIDDYTDLNFEVRVYT